MSEPEIPRCAECDEILTAAEYRYCKGCRHVLWDAAPLPSGHPGGRRGGDLGDGPAQLELWR